MKTVEKYVGLSLTRFMFDNANSYDFAIVRARIRGYWCILAQGSLSSLNNRLGMRLMDSMIIECSQDESDNTWFIKIDMDKEGRFLNYE